MSFNVEAFRKAFPQLERTVGPKQLVYFDAGASSLKHSQVTDRINTYNRFESSNVHRGAHQTSRQGTESYEQARSRIRDFLNADSGEQIVFTRGTTEGINFVASGLRHELSEGDEVLITPHEHHSNIVPWQVLCRQTGAVLKVVDFDRELGVTLENFEKALTDKTKVVSVIHYSNSFGQRLPVEKILKICRDRGVLTLLDSAQAVLSERIDVKSLGCDFLVFSGHKMYGPYGIGVLYLNEQQMKTLPPYQTGGSMIDRVTFASTTYADPPQKFEAGTPNVSGAIGLGEAAQVIMGMDQKGAHEHVLALREALIEGLSLRPAVELYGFPGDDYSGIVSFNIKGSHPSDVGTLLDKYGFAVRAGHHCTQPAMDLLGIPGTVRVSFAPYNSMQEVNDFLVTMQKIEEFF